MTVTVLFWSAIRIVYWLSHTPTLYGVFSLILPLFVLPLLASAYAEVNYQGFQVFQVIIEHPNKSTMVGSVIQATGTVEFENGLRTGVLQEDSW